MLDSFQLTDSAVSQTATATTTDHGKLVTGKVYAIHLDISDSSDLDVVIASVAAAGRPATTYYTKENVTADAWIYPRTLAQTTAGAATTEDQAVALPIMSQVVRLSCSNATGAAQTLTATVVYERD